eukprot:2619852-Rhodomonas_salina.1
MGSPRLSSRFVSVPRLGLQLGIRPFVESRDYLLRYPATLFATTVSQELTKIRPSFAFYNPKTAQLRKGPAARFSAPPEKARSHGTLPRRAKGFSSRQLRALNETHRNSWEFLACERQLEMLQPCLAFYRDPPFSPSESESRATSS